MNELLESARYASCRGNYFEAINLMAQVIQDQEEVIKDLQKQLKSMKTEKVEKL